ncbi:MAG TPA: GNAT family N-acetyltransferase [Hellea balneolensis]|uniref:GNAT family N-acetyltransferase n=1 Tax=Hellea balneolensis TaxID=287478 RepID=A0A7C5R0D4_9PROT|nr:GNAT family N-acetyltransferase [Hellea balneolensis]
MLSTDRLTIGRGVTSLSTTIIKPDALSEGQKALWAHWTFTNPQLYSPYFNLGYTELLARLCPDVYVLCIFENGECIGFLPFQARPKSAGRIGFARPVGAPMTDYHGLISAPTTRFNLQDVLKDAGFGAFHFSAAPSTQNELARHARTRSQCTVMDITKGAEAWRKTRDASYRRHLKSTRRRIKKSADLGPRKFVFQCQDEDVFSTLIEWKREKFRTTGKYDVLSVSWTRELLQTLWSRGKEHGLWADMHVLYFGNDIAAIDLGLTDGHTFHSWMVAYNNDFHTLAPGIQLLEALVDEGKNLGYKRLDLGAGIDGYKRHYASEDISVCAGFIAAKGPAATLSRLYGSCENFGESHLGGLGKWPGKARRRYGQISACDQSLGGRAKALVQAFRPVHH